MVTFRMNNNISPCWYFVPLLVIKTKSAPPWNIKEAVLLEVRCDIQSRKLGFWKRLMNLKASPWDKILSLMVAIISSFIFMIAGAANEIGVQSNLTGMCTYVRHPKTFFYRVRIIAQCYYGRWLRDDFCFLAIATVYFLCAHVNANNNNIFIIF